MLSKDLAFIKRIIVQFFLWHFIDIQVEPVAHEV